jgi:excisionase family DNA binding protein
VKEIEAGTGGRENLAINDAGGHASPRSNLENQSGSIILPIQKDSLVAAHKLSLAESAKAMGVSQTAVRRLIHTGKLPLLKIGGTIKILERDLEKFLTQGYVRMTPSQPQSSPSRQVLPPHVAKSRHFR